MSEKNKCLDEWIRQELMVDLETALSKHKERVKSILRLSKEGHIIIVQPNLTAKQKVVTYMIGKRYSNFAKLSNESSVTNQELISTLQFPDGTVKHILHELRDEGIITSIQKGEHEVRIEQIGCTLDRYFGAR